LKERRSADPFAELYGEFSERLRGDRWQPEIDVYETEEELVVRAELAGIAGSDLRVAIDGQVLRISGIRRAPERRDLRRLHQMEIATGPFERVVQISLAFERERVSAHLADGFLTVTLPKRKAQRIQVERGASQ
jgi:HSP20 family protein